MIAHTGPHPKYLYQTPTNAPSGCFCDCDCGCPTIVILDACSCEAESQVTIVIEPDAFRDSQKEAERVIRKVAASLKEPKKDRELWEPWRWERRKKRKRFAQRNSHRQVGRKKKRF